MAQRRMFSPDIVESDAFLDMPVSSQTLYFHLAMRADDDGFVNPRSIMRLVGVGDDDLKVLIAKRFLLPFESGVVVIKHWLIHNLIRADLYKETLYKQEKKSLGLNESGSYTELREGIAPLKGIEPPKWLKQRRGELRTANVPQTALRIGKDRLGKERDTYGVRENVFLSKEEHMKLCDRYGRSAVNKLIEEMSTYQASNGKKYKDHYAALLNWASRKGIVEDKVKPTPPKLPEKTVSAEEQKKVQERMKEIGSKFKMPI